MTHLTDKEFKSIGGKKKAKYMLGSLSLFLCTFLAVSQYEKKESTFLFITIAILGISFACSCIAGMILENKKYTNYSCKECGSKFEDYELGEKDEFIFICNKCAITWHTETYRPD